jgi:hypothetical protein
VYQRVELGWLLALAVFQFQKKAGVGPPCHFLWYKHLGRPQKHLRQLFFQWRLAPMQTCQ